MSSANLYQPKIAKITAYHKYYDMGVQKEGILKRQLGKLFNPQLLRCEWKQLLNTKIHNENILISDFPQEPPYQNPPIFDNAKIVFLDNNYEKFHYYYLNKYVFPNNPTFYVNGYIRNQYELQQGFKIFLTPKHYDCAKRISPNNNLIDKIEIEDYVMLFKEYRTEDVFMSKYTNE